MTRSLPIAFVSAIAIAMFVIAACSSDDDAAKSSDAGVAEAAGPLPSSKYRGPVEAGVLGADTVRYGLAGQPTACAAKASPDPDLVTACALRLGCSYGDPYPMSDCISQNLIATDDFGDCYKGAKTCVDTNACAPNGYADGYSEKHCGFAEHGTRCDGNIRYQCDTVPPRFDDCRKTGGYCVPDKADAAATTYPCLGLYTSGFTVYPKAGIDCKDYNYYPGTCLHAAATDGGKPTETVVYCQSQTTMFIDCVDLGMVCVDYASGAKCRKPTGKTCADTGISDTCDGTTIVSCNAGRKETKDCAAQGLTCRVVDGKPACVDATCSTEDAAKCRESCDGPFANVCVGGARYVVDCRAHGFKNCQTYTTSSTLFHGDYAKCTIY